MTKLREFSQKHNIKEFKKIKIHGGNYESFTETTKATTNFD